MKILVKYFNETITRYIYKINTTIKIEFKTNKFLFLLNDRAKQKLQNT